MSYTNRERLEHILLAADKVRAMLNGVSKEQFLTDDEKIAAVSYMFVIVGEASAQLTHDFREEHEEEIPWFYIIGMRNIIVHDYIKLSPAVIWKTATADLPVLAEKVKTILNGMT